MDKDIDRKDDSSSSSSSDSHMEEPPTYEESSKHEVIAGAPAYPQPLPQPLPYNTYPLPQGGQQYGNVYSNPAMAQTTVITVPATTTVYRSNMIVADTPITVVCPCCQQMVTSRREYVTGCCTYSLFLFLFIFFLPLFCCWLLPFFMTGTKDVYHFCPRCNALLGVYNR